MNEIIRIHNFVKGTSVLGPGKRAAIWFQGCKRCCPGCMSESSRSLDGGKKTTVEKVVNVILSLEDIEGITISGGEPFLQIDALYSLVKNIKEKSALTIIIYTGYTIDELRNLNNNKVNQIIDDMTDILIDGEYVDSLNDGAALRGSSNQTVHFLSDRYKEAAELYTSQKRNAEIYASDKELFFVGIPGKETLEEWLVVASTFNDNDNK